MIDDAIKKLHKLKRFSPFFMEKQFDEVIRILEESKPVTCGHCEKLKVQDDSVFYCELYKCAKPWDGYCEKGRER
jgi:hypothetical protein